jgi:UDP-glucose-4-epimerase GalE
MSRVVVTGGAGYIGSHAVRALKDAGHDVAVLDDMSAGHEQAVPQGVPIVRARIHDRDVVAKLLRDHRADAVMHFAAWLAVGESVVKPIEYYQNNVAGTLAVLDAMREAGVKRFIFSSTCAVYGEPSRVPIDETLDKNPINAYGETKLTIERALPHLERAHGIKWVALRYFNAAGAHPDGTIGEDHADEVHVIPLAIRAANGGTPMKVFGEDYPTPDGTCLRDYIHVCDLADAHIRALEALERGAPSGAFNVGTGTPHSVKSVLDTVSRVVGRPVAWQSAPRRPGDPAVLYAAADRARNELGWRPNYTDLEVIVRHAWQWHKSHPRGYTGSTEPH